MRVTRTVALVFVVGLVVGVTPPLAGQSPTPDEAAPSTPDNPFAPPPCTGTVFTDVTCSTTFDPWIEQFAADAITGGCGGAAYCPSSGVTRAQMAVFVEKAMRGTASWGPGDRGRHNTVIGFQALYNNTTDGGNTAIGAEALFTQSYANPGFSVHLNTAVGYQALRTNQPTAYDNGVANTAVGYAALLNNTTGARNTAVGVLTLNENTTASRNTAFGYAALIASTGIDNTAVGNQAGARYDTITGYTGSSVNLTANTTGRFNTFVGITGATADDVDNCTAVGMDAYCDATNQVRLGNFFVSSIGGKVAWSALSDARAKSDIHDLELGLPFVLALRPVSYRYKSGNGRIDMGFVGQDVEALLGDAYNVVDVGGDTDRTLSLRYSELIAPLVRAVQEQEAEILTRDTRIAQLEEQARAQQARLGVLEEEVRTLVGEKVAASASGR